MSLQTAIISCILSQLKCFELDAGRKEKTGGESRTKRKFCRAWHRELKRQTKFLRWWMIGTLHMRGILSNQRDDPAQSSQKLCTLFP